MESMLRNKKFSFEDRIGGNRWCNKKNALNPGTEDLTSVQINEDRDYNASRRSYSIIII